MKVQWGSFKFEVNTADILALVLIIEAVFKLSHKESNVEDRARAGRDTRLCVFGVSWLLC